MADHPYRALEDRAFWSRSVARDFDPGMVSDCPPFKFDSGDRFMSAGSCFAANVRRYLEAWGFAYTLTELPHPQWPEAAESAYYEAFSARYGNVYTARQMAQLLLRASGDFLPAEDHWVCEGRFVDPYRPGLRHRARSLLELRALTAQHLRAVRRAVETSSVLIFTLGLTEAWVSAADGAVFPAAPGTVAGEFDSSRHRFVNFSTEEVCRDLDSMIESLRAMNPAIRLVLTVSPVPLVATASGRHVLVATAYSKAVLRVAADEAIAHHEGVAYFPAYEMALGPQFRELPFEEDLRSVREPVVAAVMTGFRATFFSEPRGPVKAATDSAQAVDLVAEALVAECEEMMADEQLRSTGATPE